MQDAVEERFGRRPAPLRIVPGALEVVDGWADVQVPSVVRLERLAGSGREIWEFAQEAVHLRHDARRLDAADLSEELGVDGVRGDESLERRLHIHVREDGPGHHSLPVLELDAGRPAVVREDTADRGRRLGPGPMWGGPFRGRRGDAAHAALRVSEGLLDAVDLMEQHVAEHEGGTGRLRPG